MRNPDPDPNPDPIPDPPAAPAHATIDDADPTCGRRGTGDRSIKATQ